MMARAGLAKIAAPELLRRAADMPRERLHEIAQIAETAGIRDVGHRSGALPEPLHGLVETQANEKLMRRHAEHRAERPQIVITAQTRRVRQRLQIDVVVTALAQELD